MADRFLASAIANCGRTYQQMERYEDALTDFNHFIELDPGNERFAVILDEIIRLLGEGKARQPRSEYTQPIRERAVPGRHANQNGCSVRSA